MSSYLNFDSFRRAYQSQNPKHHCWLIWTVDAKVVSEGYWWKSEVQANWLGVGIWQWTIDPCWLWQPNCIVIPTTKSSLVLSLNLRQDFILKIHVLSKWFVLWYHEDLTIHLVVYKNFISNFNGKKLLENWPLLESFILIIICINKCFNFKRSNFMSSDLNLNILYR